MPSVKTRRSGRSEIVVTGATGNNLRSVDLHLPTGVWTAVTGVSGSGKSTLIMDTLAPAVQGANGAAVFAAHHERITVGETVDRVVVVDQRPLGRSPRSTPVTYIKAWDKIRKLFAATPASSVVGSLAP